MANNELLGTSEQAQAYETPLSARQDLGSVAYDLVDRQEPGLITTVPGVETSTYLSPEDSVAAINEQLAARPKGAGRPEVRAGGTDGIITQRA